MRVRFLTDFHGMLTEERFFRAGELAEFDDAVAAELIADGRAEEVAPETQPAKKNKQAS